MYDLGILQGPDRLRNLGLKPSDFFDGMERRRVQEHARH